jgi:phage tail tape-measure protein
MSATPDNQKADTQPYARRWQALGVLVASLLVIAFRTVIAPLQAAVVNLLAVGAAYGIVTAVFQEGFRRDRDRPGRRDPDRVVRPDDDVTTRPKRTRTRRRRSPS